MAAVAKAMKSWSWKLKMETNNRTLGKRLKERISNKSVLFKITPHRHELYHTNFLMLLYGKALHKVRIRSNSILCLNTLQFVQQCEGDVTHWPKTAKIILRRNIMCGKKPPAHLTTHSLTHCPFIILAGVQGNVYLRWCVSFLWHFIIFQPCQADLDGNYDNHTY